MAVSAVTTNLAYELATSSTKDWDFG